MSRLPWPVCSRRARRLARPASRGRRWPSLALSLLLPLAAARADMLELCLDEEPHPPFVLADGQGRVPDAVRAAARELGWTVRFRHAPLRRCWQEMEAGRVHGYPAVGAAQLLRQRFVFPLRDGAPDPARATLRLRAMLFRRRGSGAGWDGRRFSGLDGAVVLAPAGAPLLAERLTALGAPVDNSAKTLAQNFDKLLHGRGALVAGLYHDGLDLLRQPRYASQIEMLAPPLMQSEYYLVVAPDYYAQQRARVEALWRLLGQRQQQTGGPPEPGQRPGPGAPGAALGRRWPGL